MVEYSIQNENRDAIIIISGDRSSGKTRLLLKLLMAFAKRRGEKLDLKKDVYYTTVLGLREEMLTHTKLRRGLDEGMFAVLNLDSTTTRVKEFMQATTAIRNRGHILVINLVKITRGAKIILELCNYWFHKSNIDTAILYVRDRELVGEDAWNIEDMMKAKTLGKKRYFMKNNPNYLTWMKIKPIKKEIFDEYEINKRAEQEKLGNIQTVVEEGKARQALIMDTLEKEFRQKKFDFNTIREYLKQKYEIPEIDCEQWTRRFRKHLGETRMANKMIGEIGGGQGKPTDEAEDE